MDSLQTDWSRRSVVKAGAAGAAGSLLLPQISLAQPAATSGSGLIGSGGAGTAMGAMARPIDANTRIRIGIIGCGGRGTGAAVQALRADPNSELVCMADVFPDRLNSCYENVLRAMNPDAPEEATIAELKTDRVNVPPEARHVGFDSYQKVIASNVDVVLLTSYPAFRPAHLKAAIEAGKHVFAEKPVAVDGPGIRSVLESAALAKQKNLALLVGFCWRFHGGMQAVFEKILGGTIGNIVTAHTTYYTSTLSKRPRKPEWSDIEFQLRNWWHFNWISGDHIVEQAVHSVDRLAWAFNDKVPSKVITLGGRAARTGPESGDVFDHFSAVYEYDDGRRGFHSTRQMDGCPSDNTDYIYGTKGRATVNGWVPTLECRDPAGSMLWNFPKETKTVDMYQQEHNELFKSIRAGAPINDCVRGANSTMMAIMARMAAYTGQTISWEQAMNSKEVLGPSSLTLSEYPTGPVPVPGKTRFF
jgi:predicted dehydrogenase